MLEDAFRTASEGKKKSNLLSAISGAFPAKGHSAFFGPPPSFPVERKGSIELQSTLCYTLQEAQPILK